MIESVAGSPSNARTLEIGARLDELARLRSFVRTSCAELGAADDCIVDLVQAVDEAATNIVTHGYLGSAGRIGVTIDAAADRVWVVISDRAPSFDPTSVVEPDLASSHLRPGGMGVHLMRAATDVMTHQGRPGGGNVLTLVRTLGSRDEEE